VCKVSARANKDTVPSAYGDKVARWLSPIAAMLLPLFALAQPTSAGTATTFEHATPGNADGLLYDVSFTEYPPLSSNSELIRRLMSPFAAVEIQRELALSGKRLSDQSIDLSQEKFMMYVPSGKPPHGYALLVFVPPWQDQRLPRGWASVLDHFGIIFASAARSGNDENPVGRRFPLALIAADNIMRRFEVNPEQVYIGGFSGGSRIAMRLALGYPDVFRGALLNAGSDPIGDGASPLPPKDLFLQFQNSTRLVYVTGAADSFHIGMDEDSVRSVRKWCVFNLAALVTPSVGHEVADQSAFSLALAAMLKPSQTDPGKLAACRVAVEAELAKQLQKAESAIAKGDRRLAKKILNEIDARYGGLAAPRSIELSQSPDSGPPARDSAGF
jgi:pimeloyl-ACP methyl ester carboxylesterase